MPPSTIGPRSCSWRWNAVTIPKLPPPPRRPQNSSGSRCRDAIDLAPVGGDDLGLDQVVAHEAELALEPPAAAAQREPGDAGGRNAPAGDGEPVLLGRGVDLAPGAAGLDPRRLGRGIDVDALHAAQVDADAAVDDRRAGHAVAAAVDRDRRARCSRASRDRGGDVVGARAPGDERRPAVDHAVEDGAGLVVAGVAVGEQRAAERADGPALRSVIWNPYRDAADRVHERFAARRAADQANSGTRR